jgi:hypothetical protein
MCCSACCSFDQRANNKLSERLQLLESITNASAWFYVNGALVRVLVIGVRTEVSLFLCLCACVTLSVPRGGYVVT